MACLNVFRHIQPIHMCSFFKYWVFCLFRQPIDNLTPEERDARTVFCMQLAARIRARDLEDFFSAVGKVGWIICLFIAKVLSCVILRVCMLKWSPKLSLFPSEGQRRENDLRQKLQEIEGHCVHRVCGVFFSSPGNWTDWPEAVRGPYHCPGVSGGWLHSNLI